MQFERSFAVRYDSRLSKSKDAEKKQKTKQKTNYNLKDLKHLKIAKIKHNSKATFKNSINVSNISNQIHKRGHVITPLMFTDPHY